MVNISFDYNHETKSVTNLKVTDLSVSSLSKKAKSEDNIIIVKGGSMKLPSTVLESLGTKIGERLCIRFTDKPILATPEALGEVGGGNLVTRSSTLTCKGKTGETLATYGSRFTYELVQPGYVVLKAAKAEEMTKEAKEALKENEIKSVLEDSDFTLAIKNGSEVGFDFAN